MKRLPLLITLALLLCGCGYKKQMKQVDLAPDAELAAIHSGVQYLLEHQNEDGSFGGIDGGKIYAYELYMGTTASYKGFGLACTALDSMALMQAQDMGIDCSAAVGRSLRYLLDADPPARSTPREMYCVWAHDYVLRCFARALDRPDTGVAREDIEDRIAAWLRMLGRHQGLDGGWGYYDFEMGAQHPVGMQSTCFTTASILVTLHELRDKGIDVPEKMISSALYSLALLRNPDGTYNYGHYADLRPAVGFNRVKGTLGRSQAPNVVLYNFQRGDVDTDDLKRSLDRMIEHHHFLEIARGRPIPHETWYSNAGYYYFFGHHYAAMATALLPKEEQLPYWDKLSQWMLNAQQSNGTWWDWRFSGYQQFYGTGFALMTLIPAHQARASLAQ